VRLRPLGSPSPDASRPGDARVDYDTPHVKPWGIDMALYLLTKGVSTGAMLLSAVLWLLGDRSALSTLAGPAISLLFIIATAVILVVDLERPERFYYILIRPNWRSWMVWGTYFLIGHGAIATLWIAASWLGFAGVLDALAWPAIAIAVLATCYTGFLFAQGLARDLWLGPQSTVALLAQAVAEGAATLLLTARLGSMMAIGGDSTRTLVWALGGGIAAHLAFIVVENLVLRSATRHHALAVSAIRRGPFALQFWGGALASGAMALLFVAGAGTRVVPPGGMLIAGAVCALVSSFAWEWVWVEAGQSVPLS
jgi:formate-dependent nitrite reductase membrane component NrfD